MNKQKLAKAKSKLNEGARLFNATQADIDNHYDNFAKNYKGYIVDQHGTKIPTPVSTAFERAARRKQLGNVDKVSSKADFKKDKKSK